MWWECGECGDVVGAMRPPIVCGACGIAGAKFVLVSRSPEELDSEPMMAWTQAGMERRRHAEQHTWTE